jgi:hypothetical protein
LPRPTRLRYLQASGTITVGNMTWTARPDVHGIYLIVHRRPRPIGWMDAAGVPIQFEAVIAHLQALADSIATHSTEAPKVRVCSIDVSDM